VHNCSSSQTTHGPHSTPLSVVTRFVLPPPIIIYIVLESEVLVYTSLEKKKDSSSTTGTATSPKMAFASEFALEMGWYQSRRNGLIIIVVHMTPRP